MAQERVAAGERVPVGRRRSPRAGRRRARPRRRRPAAAVRHREPGHASSSRLSRGNARDSSASASTHRERGSPTGARAGAARFRRSATIERMHVALAQLDPSSAISPATRAGSSTPPRPARAAARRSSSRRSSRSAAIRPRTCSCGRPSSTPARRRSPRSRAAGARTDAAGRISRAARRAAAQRARGDPRRRGARASYRKQRLPNYTVFDEQRYFAPGEAPCVFEVDGVRVGAVICEDIWFPGPAAQARAAGAQMLVVPNGSPYHTQAAGGAARSRQRAGARERPAGRLRQPRRRPGRAGVRRRVVRRAPRTGRSRSRCPPGTRAIALAAFDERRAASRARRPRPAARGAGLGRAGDRACATTSARTAFPACCSASPAASTRR